MPRRTRRSMLTNRASSAGALSLLLFVAATASRSRGSRPPNDLLSSSSVASGLDPAVRVTMGSVMAVRNWFVSTHCTVPKPPTK